MNINTKVSDVKIPPQAEPVPEVAEDLTQPVKLFSTYAESHGAPTPNIEAGNINNIDSINIDRVNDDYLHADIFLGLTNQQPNPQGATQDISLVANLVDTPALPKQTGGSIVEELISSSTVSNEIQTPLSTSNQLNTNLAQQAPEDTTPENINPKDINNVITNSLSTNSETNVLELNNAITNSLSTNSETNAQPKLPTAETVVTNVLETDNAITNSLSTNSETNVQPKLPTAETVVTNVLESDNVITNSVSTNSETNVQPTLPTAQFVATNILETNIVTAQTDGLTEQVKTTSTVASTETNLQANTSTVEPVARELTLATTVTPQSQNRIDHTEAPHIDSSAQKDIQSNNPIANSVPLKEPTVPPNTPQLLVTSTQDNISAHALTSSEAIKTDPVSIIPKISLDAAAPLATVANPIVDTQVRVPHTANITTNLPTSHPAIQTIAQNLVKVQETQSGISVRLDPPEMGRVYIDFQFDTDRSVIATLRSDVAETAVHLKDKAEFFQQILKENGFNNVTLNFEQNNTSQDNSSDSFDESPSFSNTGSELEEATTAALPANTLYKLSPETAIDIKL
ncbi:MAG: flagellar hook-length control protein FliK [Maricaulaceae bacterium]